MNYKAYLKSEHWALMRGAKVQLNPHCEKCGSKTEIEVHHKIYRARWQDAKLSDLKTLCHHCHATHHAAQDAGEHFSPKEIRRILRPKKQPPIQSYVSHQPKPIFLPSVKLVTWENRKGFKITKASYAWLMEKGLGPDRAGWRERLRGYVCPSEFFG